MKVLAINCSPAKPEGNTALILNPFLEGIKEAGGQVDLFYSYNLKIKPCLGEYACLFKTPGVCFQKDDMHLLYPKMREADITVWSTPIYCYSITGSMKNIIDRTFALTGGTEEEYELRDGRSYHATDKGSRKRKTVIISSCGQWELDNFDPMLAHMNALLKHSTTNEFAGALLRPHAHVLKAMAQEGALDDIFEAAKEAGKLLINDGKIPSRTLETITRALITVEAYVQMINDVTNAMKLEAQKAS